MKKQALAGILAATAMTWSSAVLAQSSTSGRSGGLMVEPILSMTNENATLKTSQLPLISDDSSGTLKGYGLGARVGVHAADVVFIGIDGRYSRLDMQDSAYEQAAGDAFNYGPTIGVQTPFFGIRLMGTYIMGGEFNPGPGVQAVDLKFENLRGYRVGGGLHFAAVAVNLEYQNSRYENANVESFGSLGGQADTSVDFENEGYTLSLSFPVEL